MYDVSKLQTPDDCRIVMQRAREKDLDDFYRLVFARYCELVGKENEDPSDLLIADFFETLGAYEQLLTEKNGKKTLASRTRQKIANKGVHQSLIEWTRGKVETNGFTLLVQKGLPEYTGEYLVAKYAERFPKDVVELAHKRLQKYDIKLPAVI